MCTPKTLNDPSARPPRQRCTRYVALHPLRGATPNQKGCNADGSGAVPTDRVQCPRNNHNCAQRLPTHPIRQSQTQPHSHEILAPAAGWDRSRNEAGTTPVTGQYTRYGAQHPNRRGVMPTDRVQCLQIGCSAPATTTTARNACPHTLSGSPRRSHTATRYSPQQRVGIAAETKWALHPLRCATPDTLLYTRYVAMHPLRAATPEQKGCNANGSGAVPPRQEQKRAALCQQLDNVARALPRSCRKLGGAPRCPPSSDTTDQRTVSIPHQVVTGRGRCSAALRH